MVFRGKGPQTGEKIELHCASCDAWICSYYEYPRGSGVVHPRFDKRIKHVERISRDMEPIETAVFVFRCPKRSCQRAHVLRGATIAACCRTALRTRAKRAVLPDDDG